jgi:diaminopimelate decarboxylase
MEPFEYRDGRLYAEDVPLAELAARFGTPQYVYSRAALEHQWRAFDEALGRRPHRICYAVKANSDPDVLATVAACRKPVRSSGITESPSPQEPVGSGLSQTACRARRPRRR